MNNFKCRVLINFEALQQVAIFPHSLILSLFFNVDWTIDLFKKSNICKHWTGILTPNDTQLDCHWPTSCMLFTAFSFTCFFASGYDWENPKNNHGTQDTCDITYTTLYHVKHKTKLQLCAAMVCHGFFRSTVIPRSIQQVADQLLMPPNCTWPSVNDGISGKHRCKCSANSWTV
jgi:hypothetical protein